MESLDYWFLILLLLILTGNTVINKTFGINGNILNQNNMLEFLLL